MIKSKIISGDVGSVRNELNTFVADVLDIISVTQSFSNGILVITVFYRPSTKNKED